MLRISLCVNSELRALRFANMLRAEHFLPVLLMQFDQAKPETDSHLSLVCGLSLTVNLSYSLLTQLSVFFWAIMETQAPVQLSHTDEEAERRWESMNEIDLNAEIDAYRVSLRNTSERLTAIGISPNWEGDQLTAGASDRGNDSGAADGEDDIEARWLEQCTRPLMH